MSQRKYARRDIGTFDLYTRKNYEKFQDFNEPLLLDHNENWLIDAEWQRELLKKVLESLDIRRYPAPYSLELTRTLSNFLHVKEEKILVGNGLDDVIDILTRTFIEKGDEVITHVPTFGHYKTTTMLAGGKFVPVLLKESFDLDVEEMLAAVDEKTKLIFLCSPNNPTGNQFKKSDVEALLQESGKIVVVDEAYVDFAKDTVLDLIKKYQNLIVLRSFSKSFGFAGLRLGFSVANEEFTAYMKKIQHPYSVGIFSQAAVEEFLKHWDYVENTVARSNEEREKLYSELSEINGVKPYPSDANFLLTRFETIDKNIANERFVKQGIFVKDLQKQPLCENCLRISVGTPSMNRRLIATLRLIIKD